MSASSASGSDGGGFCEVDRRLADTVGFMRSAVAEPLSVARLAARVGLSASSLSRLFSKHLGISPHAALRRLRLARAAALARDSDLLAKQLAAAVGYRDVSHFARDIRRFHGTTPRRFRLGRTGAPEFGQEWAFWPASRSFHRQPTCGTLGAVEAEDGK